MNSVSGNVVSIQANADGKSGIVRWFRALAGRPYTKDGDYVIIQITLPNSPSNLTQIVFHGKIGTGAIIQGNNITAHGKFTSSGEFVAKEIHNDTTGVTINPVSTISPNIIRIVTLIPILILAILVATGAIVTVAYAVLGILALVVILYIMIKLFPILLLGWLSGRR